MFLAFCLYYIEKLMLTTVWPGGVRTEIRIDNFGTPARCEFTASIKILYSVATKVFSTAVKFTIYFKIPN